MTDKLLLVLAALGAVMVFFVARMFLPDTPAGSAVVFAVYWVAVYPVASRAWLSRGRRWRHWAGLLVGVFVVWVIETWRVSSGFSATVNSTMGATFFVLATVALLAVGWKTVRH